jgi:hypothetical protein
MLDCAIVSGAWEESSGKSRLSSEWRIGLPWRALRWVHSTWLHKRGQVRRFEMSDNLAKRIDRLESIEAIKKLKHLYMNYCDLGYPPDKLGPLFADNAVWTSRDFGRHPGRPAIEAFFSGISAQIVFAAHLAMNFIIDVDGDSGTGKWRILMPCTMVEEGKRVSRWLLGDYDEKYVRLNGVWLFRKIDFVVNFNVPFDQSWAESAIVRPS